MSLRILLIAAIFLSIEAQTPRPDTARLAALLRSARGTPWLSQIQFRQIQSAYLNWIDARMTVGIPVAQMNDELQTAGLFLAPEAELGPENMEQPKTGYLAPLSARPAHATADVIILDAAIYLGRGCTLDSTAVVYTRDRPQRLAHLTAWTGNTKYAYQLAGFDVAPAAPDGSRLFASGWVISNCSSTWNGKQIRIDRISGPSLHPVLSRSLDAQSGFQDEDVAPRIEDSEVTFHYQGATGDGDFLSLPTLARYRVTGTTARRIAPIALTRVGFLYEWLRMSHAEAGRWADPQPLAAHHSAAAAISYVSEWTHVGRCPGPVVTWEIGLRPYESNDTYLFRLRGARAADLHLLSIHRNAKPTCPAADPGPSPLATPLPESTTQAKH